MKNIVIVVLVVICGFSLLYAFQQRSLAGQLRQEIGAFKEAAEASSAEAFILQKQAEEHKAEAEKHRQAAEEHKKIAEEALQQVEKLKK